ncbi:hypothetical protein [Mucilaginibacter gotjawali]|uniref:Uncharacterized protein n=2 Tax=Mucilaginibacter gotjawali TaxID=1550579 RepID=A0A125T2C3_9SPHI|nr:hypothetical protein [Mucilaginibacter gotjawali]MBB3056494.1 hypothetical protein [Mucilaginibacter gotjawali]BAU52804.1 hypothetical protein MgSA37_00967 [Mucilaginibacter gotjawali]
MRTFVSMVLALIILTAVSCKKSTQLPSNALIGKWRWVRSVGGIGGFTYTPQSTGNNFRDEFYADSTYKRFENDSLLIQGSYSIIKGYNYTPTQKVDVLKIGDWRSSISIKNDTLFIDDLFISDGFGDTYVRIR